ncbi:hypothetical protein AC626_24110 [Pseudoalteromonas rubra]|uniref:Uncharacterized protein n=1 Tax=Pseudoalteromonas rubra TaxID=43658 RepID=A0A0L0ELD9_9GAMM|nr:hypothetical protein AC626_24110 [Pseudoalteromonas rubra]
MTLVVAGSTDSNSRVKLTGYADNTETVSVELTPPAGLGPGSNFSFTRSSDFNNALWQNVDVVEITFPDADVTMIMILATR